MLNLTFDENEKLMRFLMSVPLHEMQTKGLSPIFIKIMKYYNSNSKKEWAETLRKIYSQE